MTIKVPIHIWEGCYDKGLKSFIVPDAFAHPAKYSLGLIERIFDYCLERGYLHKGDVVGDPFGGVAIGGLVAAYRGLRFIGVELEPKFFALCRANIKLHRSKLEYLGFPLPVIMQGDSRKFHEHVQASGIVSSPPYADAGGTPSLGHPEKNGLVVPLCDDTCRLLEHIGFQMVERIHAMLVKETRHEDLFNGHTVQTKSRKSFFRRLAEKNGSPKIDFEEVLIARKPL